MAKKMEEFTVRLVRHTEEHMDVTLKAKTLEAAREKALKRYEDGDDFDGKFDLVDSQTHIDEGEDEDLSPRSRVTKIETLIHAGEYETEAAVRDMLADIRHYCDANGIDFADEDGRAYDYYCVEVSDAKRSGNHGKR